MGAGQGRQVAADAVAQGARTVISLGGDGTHNEVLNGLLDSGAPDLTLGVLHGGTGGDFRRSLTHQGAVEGLDAPASVIVKRTTAARTMAMFFMSSVL